MFCDKFILHLFFHIENVLSFDSVTTGFVCLLVMHCGVPFIESLGNTYVCPVIISDNTIICSSIAPE